MQLNCDKETSIPHAHEFITIKLGGTYATGETGTAYLNGENLGEVTEGRHRNPE